MAGKFTKTFDDDCKIISRTGDNVKQFDFQLYMGQQKNCDRCFQIYGGVPTGHWYDSKNSHLVDQETVLKNQSYSRFGCGRDNVRYLDVNQQNPDADQYFSKFLSADPTLLSHPKWHYRELVVDRFFDHPRAQESHVFWDYSANSRLQAKDAFVQLYPTPISANPSIPPIQRSRGEVPMRLV